MPVGHLQKMHVELGDPITYQLLLDQQPIILNAYLGQKIRLQYLNEIQCVACGRAIKKTFNQGYCYPCYRSLACCDQCILRPELCHYAQGTCREPKWGEQHCMQPHIIYLANASHVKVGITRQTQIPTRWIDQGAVQALPFFRVQTRLQSGLIEVALKQYIADKTNWRTMLRGEPELTDLQKIKNNLLTKIESELHVLKQRFGEDAITLLQADVVRLTFPVAQYPEKVVSMNFDKQDIIEGELSGIKGQYLLFKSGQVLNIRKFSGYRIEFT